MSNIGKLFSIGLAIILLLTLVPSALAQATPSVTVTDQAIVNGKLVIDSVVSDGPGWIVIHTQADGKPGPLIGFSPVVDGENTNLVVEIDPTKATRTLYAMLHTDAGQVGTWEFPGPDGPVQVDGQVVSPAFNVKFGVGVADQSVASGRATVAKVISDGPGWIVIHAQADGKPGPILGFSPVADGENSDVMVELDTAGVTGTLYAMLHTDGGQIGTWEFPGGPDVPMAWNGQVITPPFQVSGGLPATLPEAGGSASPWPILLLAVGVLALITGFGLTLAPRKS